MSQHSLKIRLSLLVLAGVALGVPPSAYASASGCEARAKENPYRKIVRPHGSSAGGAIYEVKKTDQLEVCSFAGGSTYDLGDGYSGDTTFNLVVFAGRDAAVELEFRDSPSYLVVLDLQRDRRIYRRGLGGYGASPSPFTRELGAIVLKPDGSLAWTEDFPGESESELTSHTPADVVRHDRHGTKVLDATQKAQAGSLQLKGSTLHWVDGEGEARSAKLD